MSDFDDHLTSMHVRKIQSTKLQPDNNGWERTAVIMPLNTTLVCDADRVTYLNVTRGDAEGFVDDEFIGLINGFGCRIVPGQRYKITRVFEETMFVLSFPPRLRVL